MQNIFIASGPPLLWRGKGAEQAYRLHRSAYGGYAGCLGRSQAEDRAVQGYGRWPDQELACGHGLLETVPCVTSKPGR